MKKIIAALASHNRCEKTLACLSAFFENKPEGYQLSAVLLDDGSTDRTGELVEQRFGGRVDVIRGDGSFFWNGGMRRAIEIASRADPDFLLWLNDDTLIDNNALAKLLMSHQALASVSTASIVVGAIRDTDLGRTITYGGLYRARWFQRTKWSRLDESEDIQHCETMNGNCVLVSRATLVTVGNLSPDFTHSMGDLDYGLRAVSLGCELVVAPGTVGTCARNGVMGTFEDRCASLSTRWRHLVSIKGLPPREWATFTRRHAGPCWWLYWIWPYLRSAVSVVTPSRLSRRDLA